MPEPTTTTTAAVAISTTSSQTGPGLAALFVAMLGPLAGPHSLIVFAALAGSLWPLSGAEAMTHKAGAWLMLRCTMTAVVLTAVIAKWLESTYQLQAVDTLAPVAFFIGALGNGWRPVFDLLAGSLGRFVSGFGGPKP